MEIYTITKYRFEGVDHDSLESVRCQVENGIGAIIDSSPRPLSPKDRLAVLVAIVKNHKRLKELLSAEYTRDNDELQPEIVNILDMDL